MFFFFRLLQISISIVTISNRLNAILTNVILGHFITDVFRRPFIVLHNKLQWLNWLIYWKWQREGEKETKSVTSKKRGGNMKTWDENICALSKISIISSIFQKFQDHLQLLKSENLDIHWQTDKLTNMYSPFQINYISLFHLQTYSFFWA